MSKSPDAGPMSAITDSDRNAGITRKTTRPKKCPECKTLNVYWSGKVCLTCEVKRRKAMAMKWETRS